VVGRYLFLLVCGGGWFCVVLVGFFVFVLFFLFLLFFFFFFRPENGSASAHQHGARALGVADRLPRHAAATQRDGDFGKPWRAPGSSSCSSIPMSSCMSASLMVYQAAAKAMPARTTASKAYVCKPDADEMAFASPTAECRSMAASAAPTDLTIEKFCGQQRSSAITEGATEVMKMVIARHVLEGATGLVLIPTTTSPPSGGEGHRGEGGPEQERLR